MAVVIIADVGRVLVNYTGKMSFGEQKPAIANSQTTWQPPKAEPVPAQTLKMTRQLAVITMRWRLLRNRLSIFIPPKKWKIRT